MKPANTVALGRNVAFPSGYHQLFQLEWSEENRDFGEEAMLNGFWRFGNMSRKGWVWLYVKDQCWNVCYGLATVFCSVIRRRQFIALHASINLVSQAYWLLKSWNCCISTHIEQSNPPWFGEGSLRYLSRGSTYQHIKRFLLFTSSLTSKDPYFISQKETYSLW